MRMKRGVEATREGTIKLRRAPAPRERGAGGVFSTTLQSARVAALLWLFEVEKSLGERILDPGGVRRTGKRRLGLEDPPRGALKA